eukprot:Gb_36822 [translate_table: standard]
MSKNLPWPPSTNAWSLRSDGHCLPPRKAMIPFAFDQDAMRSQVPRSSSGCLQQAHYSPKMQSESHCQSRASSLEREDTLATVTAHKGILNSPEDISTLPFNTFLSAETANHHAMKHLGLVCTKGRSEQPKCLTNATISSQKALAYSCQGKLDTWHKLHSTHKQGK